MWAYLRYVNGLVVNQKRIYGVMKAKELLVKSNPKLRPRRKADIKKPKPTRAHPRVPPDLADVRSSG